jgi:hypothetical protein
MSDWMINGWPGASDLRLAVIRSLSHTGLAGVAGGAHPLGMPKLPSAQADGMQVTFLAHETKGAA